MALFALGGVTVIAMVTLAFLALVRIGNDDAAIAQAGVAVMWAAYAAASVAGVV